MNKCGDKYSGSWKDGLKHGKGKLVTAAAVLCGDDGFKGRNHRCSGTAKCGEEQGKQKWKVKDNIQVYEGDWLDDKKCGIGKIVYHSGVVFEGELEDDKPVKVMMIIQTVVATSFHYARIIFKYLPLLLLYRER